MKQVYSLVILLLMLSCGLNAQVNLPYTLDFTTNQSISGNIIWDGQGGTADINELNIKIYATDFNAPLTNYNMVWADAAYWYVGDGVFNGIGPDYGDNLGVPALVIKSDNPANPFTLVSMSMYDWGDTSPWTIYTYRNGIFVGSVNVNFDHDNYYPFNATRDNILSSSVFQNHYLFKKNSRVHVLAIKCYPFARRFVHLHVLQRRQRCRMHLEEDLQRYLFVHWFRPGVARS